MTIEESKDLSTLPLDELIDNLKVNEVVLEKDLEIYINKKEKYKSLALKARKVLSEEEATSSDSNDEEYVMAFLELKSCSLRGFFQTLHLLGLSTCMNIFLRSSLDILLSCSTKSLTTSINVRVPIDNGYSLSTSIFHNLSSVSGSNNLFNATYNSLSLSSVGSVDVNFSFTRLHNFTKSSLSNAFNISSKN
ncbi:hypothetical protein Tco_0917684 [Tanacetum coccineum]